MPDVPQEPAQTDREWMQEQLARVRREAAELRAQAEINRRDARQVRIDNATVRRHLRGLDIA